MSETKSTTTTPAAAPAASAAPAAKVEVGAVVRLRAVHGFIQDPFTLDTFDVETEKKVVANAWTVLQFNAGKLALSE
jgi:hypothetical protein